MKYNYFVMVQDYQGCESIVTHEIEQEHKYSAFVLKLSENQNIASVVRDWRGLHSMTLFSTKKKAEEIARVWNECYKKNGTFAY